MLRSRPISPALKGNLTPAGTPRRPGSSWEVSLASSDRGLAGATDAPEPLRLKTAVPVGAPIDALKQAAKRLGVTTEDIAEVRL